MNLALRQYTFSPWLLLRLEGLAVLVGSMALYIEQGGRGWVFALLLFSFDLSMLGYGVNSEVGSQTYNLIHSYTLPLLLLVGAILTDWAFGVQFGLIWTAHIGMDRMLGFGLKYASEFKATHLNRA